MDLLELKFLLNLLGFPDYRGSIAEIKPNPKTKADQRDSICRQLCDREILACSAEITKFSIAPPGKSLLKLDTAGLPISEAELQVLRACADGPITPADTKLATPNRQSIIQGLADRGLIKPEKTQIQEVWLTQRGLEYLRDEYLPSDTDSAISLDLLGNYLRFLRKFLVSTAETEGGMVSPSGVGAIAETTAPTAPAVAAKPTDVEVLQLIRQLDHQLATENYLPIFHLRQALQPVFSRDELDRTLYRLQRNDQIELSSLQEAIAYTPEQIDAGIPQDVGGPLFFIIVTSFCTPAGSLNAANK